jgi:surface polysaccharide O-acyltransferase-like enzyme
MIPHIENSPIAQVAVHNCIPSLSERLFYPDLIRALSAIAIVFLHVSSPIAQNFSGYSKTWWWTADIFYSCARPSIVLFVMISGLLLLSPSKEESIGRFLKKRFLRIMAPFVVWGTVYFFWKVHGHFSLTEVIQLVKDFITGPVYYHLWFIYTIAGIYLAAPVFRVYVKHASRANQTYLLFLWFIGSALYPLFRHFAGFSIGIPIMVAGGFLGAFLLGYFLRDFETGKKFTPYLLLIAIVCLTFTAVSTYYLSINNDMQYDGTFEDFLSPNVVLAAVSLFLLCKNLPFEGLRTKAPALYRGVLSISSASFSIYLMHILVLEILKSHVPWFSLDACTFHPIFGIPLTAIVTMALCLTVVVIMRKIPFMQFIFP